MCKWVIPKYLNVSTGVLYNQRVLFLILSAYIGAGSHGSPSTDLLTVREDAKIGSLLFLFVIFEFCMAC
jgi:hypothetical protein